MAVFYIYCDQSGKFVRDDYISFCGYVGHASEWERFALEWNNCRMRWGVPAVHMARIMFPDRKDDEWLKIKNARGKDWDKWRDLVLGDFAATIRSAQIVAVGAIVDSKHFNALADSEFKREAKDPLFLALHTVIMRGIEVTEVIDRHSPIGLVIDDDHENSIECYRRLNKLKEHPDPMFRKVKDRVHAMSFANDVSFPGLQAADMLAYESRRFMVERITNPAAEPSDLYLSLTLLLTHQPKLYTPEILDELERGVLKMIGEGTQ